MVEWIKRIAAKFVAYLKDVSIEFKKISWPDRQELIDSSTVVITFIVILAITVAAFDKVILWVLKALHNA
ncbi:MAG: preprotein translocase subunit SecE [Kiritimatiellae bacterium]|nr:preprotein translocase subunit SecE [Kiritimatiellia bacterium]MBP5320437.1 preprotein translocase subunit SecE [Kiritimatiellia bacterium]